MLIRAYLSAESPFTLRVTLAEPAEGQLALRGNRSSPDDRPRAWTPVHAPEGGMLTRVIAGASSGLVFLDLELDISGPPHARFAALVEIVREGDATFAHDVEGHLDDNGQAIERVQVTVGETRDPGDVDEATSVLPELPPLAAKPSEPVASRPAPPSQPAPAATAPPQKPAHRGQKAIPPAPPPLGAGTGSGGAPGGPASVARTGETAAAPAASGGRYVVWFATNRAPGVATGGRVSFTAERDDHVHYGRCEVDVPASHRIGSIGSPWWKRLFMRADDRLRLRAVHESSAEAHWSAISRRLASARDDDRHAVVFIHGYNVTFEDAALRAAQIGYDLGVAGAMSFFSWPSRGTLAGYAADAASIEASEGPIADYLADFASRSGASHVHVIAHSMGNRGLLRAINRVVADAERRSPARFGQFVLAAPDVDVDVFRDLSAAYRQVCERATLYASSRDKAVEASGALHGAPRAGFTPPVTVVTGIDTVSVSNVDLTLLGHGYVADAREVLSDMHALIFHGDPPDRRMGLRAAATAGGERFWEIGG